MLPIPKITHKIAAGAAAIAALSLCGGMTLQHITAAAVATLVVRMGMDAVDVAVGTANQAFGWAAFALTVLATVGVCAVVVVEIVTEKARMAAERKAEDLVGVNVTTAVRDAAGGSAGARGVQGQSLATKLMKEGLKRARQNTSAV
jgi:lysylphosphatidylglycerol synthetase-like protein (DUF2156 family)